MKGLNVTEVARPTKVEDALTLLERWGSSARLVAGNTTIYELARQGALADVDKLIDLMWLNLDYIKKEEKDSALVVGATTTFIQLAKTDLIDDPGIFSLRETARKITPPQVRNMGTIGGAASSGIPFYDMPTTLLALDAKMKVRSIEGERTVGADDFFVDYFVTALTPKDLLSEVEIPILPNTGSAFIKIGRTAVDFAMVNCSARVTLEAGDSSSSSAKIKSARIALGAVASRPVRAKAAEEALAGSSFTREKIVEAAKKGADFDPTPSVHASSNYKKKIIPVVVRDAVLTAIDRARTQTKKPK